MERAIEVFDTGLVKRVLVVDDDLDFAESLGELIRFHSCEVETVTTVEAAYQAVEIFRPQVVMIDIRLGPDDGATLLADFIKHPLSPLCIMITGYASTESAIEALKTGAYDYLTKPVSQNVLFKTLDRCFERISLEAEREQALSALESRNSELEYTNKRLQGLVDSMGELTSSSSVSGLCHQLLEKVASSMGAEGGSVYLREGDQLQLVHSLDPGHAPSVIPMPINTNSVLGRVIEQAEAVLVSDAASSDGLMLSGWSGYRDESLLALPLVGQDNTVIGVLSLHTKQKPPFTSQDRNIGQILLAASCETLRAVKALEDLQESQSMLQLIIDSSPDCVRVLDQDRNLVQMNPAGLAMVEADSMDQVADCALETIDPEYRDAFGRLTDSVYKGESGVLECSITGRRGTHRWIEVNAVPLRNLNQNIIGSLSLTRDITQRREMENELHESRAMLQLIVDSIPECVKVLDKNGNIVQINKAGLEMCGADTFDQVDGACLYPLIKPEFREALQKLNEQAFEGEGGTLEYVLRGLKGKELWLDTYAVPLRNADQKVIGVLDVARDITQRREMEDELHESQSLLQLIVDSIPECVKVLDKDGNILQMNRAGLDMCEIDTFDQVDRACLYPFVESSHRESLQKLNQQVMNEGLSGKMEYMLVGMKGAEVWLDTHVVPLRNADEEIIGVLGVTRDITVEKREAEQAREQELNLMQANKMAALGTLVAGVAHEINNPNQTIQINSGLLGQVWTDTRKILDQHVRTHGPIKLGGLEYSGALGAHTDLINDIKIGAEQIKTVVSRLRSFSRPYDGIHDNIEGEKTRLNDAVEPAIALLRHAIRKGTNNFQTKLEKDLPAIQCNRQQLQQVVINLILNALEALSDRSQGISVATWLNTENSRVELCVRDEGGGMTPEQMEHLLEPFYTTKREQGGTGLGLSITHSLLKDYGGTIHFESRPGKGTLVVVSLPIVKH